ncbi:conjugative transfer pilus assembly protein TraH [Marinobacter nauticus]|uniref:Conjugative transfer pilus assembly protein TraH n=1 Tax=Marinobacter nauticus TaxID=2743 RepID=A0A368X4J5_MARNT|nr:conjugal transfer protein TraH [Marinobacter nauticus]RCW62920.1 conjugative transfer pilus assembly protein TraH [Marinobacter nauticus]
MKRTASKIRILAGSAITASTILMSANAYSGMQQQMETMFNGMANVTDPGTFQTQTRGGIAFGGVSVRTPIIDQNVVTWVPPSAAGGCNGIDLNGGSFSFINGQQIVNTLQAVAANAQGYAFQLALDAVYPEAAAWIEVFQKKMQSMNEYLGNSCQMAQGIVDGGIDAWKNRDNTEFWSMANVTGAAKDFYESATSGWTPEDSRTSPETADIFADRRGNIVYRALQEGQAMAKFPDGDQDMAEHIMSLLGVYIIPRQTEQGSIDDTHGARTKLGAEVSVTRESPPLFTLKQFVIGSMTGDDSGAAAPLKVWRCGTGADDAKYCETPTIQNSNFEGFTKLIEEALLGSSSAPGIIAKLQTNTGNYTNLERGVALSLPNSQFAFIRNLALKAPQAVRGYAKAAARNIALDMAYELAREALAQTIAGLSTLQATNKELVKEMLQERGRELTQEYDRLRGTEFATNESLTKMYRDIMEVTSSDELFRMTEQN